MAERSTRPKTVAAGQRRRAANAASQQSDGDRWLPAYRWMLVARRIDDIMWTLRRQGKGHFVVSSAGHEAIGAAAGLAADLHQDFLAPHYRDLTACLAWGLQPREVMAHYFGRSADPCTGGRQPYAHWGSTERRILSQEGPQPNIVTHAVGVAFASRSLGPNAVVWIGFGDGGAQKGEVHEAMNFAAIHRLPIVFCVENNLYTQSVPLRLESSVTDLSVRAASYGMPGVSVDGMDLPAVYTAAAEAIQRARSGHGPSLIEARAYRYMPNTSNDDDTRYRSRDEVETWRKRDPIGRLRGLLVAYGVLSEDAATALEREVAEEVAEAAAWAEAQPDAAPEQALHHTWAERPVAAPAWMANP
ncbi:MAG: thiamine pyrophosphate-dependent dehydrogenase E1 component subunit alpha [Chloroflexi bacterium]|nr:thiamine pyrophosphate-dependent dehydrogenase E1 component subunit alpha [Chloroflexota bacterium]